MAVGRTAPPQARWGENDDMTWTPEQLRAVASAIEIDISAPRRDGRFARAVPIWGVVAEGEVFVRTWIRRENGWYGGAVRSGVARVRAGDLSMDVSVAAVGDANAEVVDAAYRAKYGELAARSVVTTDAAASTLRLTPR